MRITNNSNEAVIHWTEKHPTALEQETPEEKAKRIGVPVIPAAPIRTFPGIHNPTVAICGACGLELKQVMGYVCSRTDCPTGLGSTIC